MAIGAVAVEGRALVDGLTFEDHVLPHRKVVSRWLLRKGVSWQDCEDMTQRVMLNAWKALPSFRGGCRVRTWLLEIATNVAYNYLLAGRREQVRNEEVLPDPVVADLLAPPPPEDGLRKVLLQEDVRRARKALEFFSEEKRQVIIDVVFDQKQYREVAEERGLPPDLVKTYVYQGRQRMIAAIEQRPVDHRRRKEPSR